MTSSITGHPFYPATLVLPVDYIPNNTSSLTLVFVFASGCLIIASSAMKGVAWRRGEESDFKIGDAGGVVWFVVSGSIHCAFEGYFLWNHDRMPGRMDLFGQLWKEYALSDSRYMFSDPMLLCMEMLSVFGLGPLCFITAWLISNDSGYRHSFQALVSAGHLYSNLVYFATSLYDDYFLDKRYYRPEPIYFWAYFVGMNAIWLVVPAILLYNSMRASARAFDEVKGTRRKVRDLYNKMKDTRTKVKVNGADKKDL